MENELYIIPLEGRNIMPSDVIRPFFGRRSDPYCNVTYNRVTQKSRVAQSTLHPVWSWSLMKFEKKPGVSKILFEVWDADMHTPFNKDDFLGQVEYELPANSSGKILSEWLELRPARGMTQTKLGRIHFRIYNGLRPSEPKVEPLGKSIFLWEEDKGLESLKTGDVMLYSGTSIVSRIIKGAMDMPYSHAGLVVKMPDPTTPNDKTEKLFLCEADWDDKDHLSPNPVYGITVNLFLDRLPKYQGDLIWVSPLKEALSPEKCKQLIDYVLKQKADGVKYDALQGIRMMLKMGNTDDSTAVFCSELVSNAMKLVGNVPASTNSSLQSPLMVSLFDCYPEGYYPRRVLRYQVEPDTKNVKGAGIHELISFVKANM